VGGAEHLYHACQGSVRASRHIQRFAGQPDGITANHRRTSRSHAAHSAADNIGQLTVAVAGPRRNPMRSSVTLEVKAAASTGTGTKEALDAVTAVSWCLAAWARHLCTRLALTHVPWRQRQSMRPDVRILQEHAPSGLRHGIADALSLGSVLS